MCRRLFALPENPDIPRVLSLCHHPNRRDIGAIEAVALFAALMATHHSLQCERPIRFNKSR
jgi:hypothetical protein